MKSSTLRSALVCFQSSRSARTRAPANAASPSMCRSTMCARGTRGWRGRQCRARGPLECHGGCDITIYAHCIGVRAFQDKAPADLRSSRARMTRARLRAARQSSRLPATPAAERGPSRPHLPRSLGGRGCRTFPRSASPESTEVRRASLTGSWRDVRTCSLFRVRAARAARRDCASLARAWATSRRTSEPQAGGVTPARVRAALRNADTCGAQRHAGPHQIVNAPVVTPMRA